MNKLLKVILAFFLFAPFASLCLPAQNIKIRPSLKARAQGRNLIISEQGKAHLLKVSKNIDAARLDGATVLFESRRPDFTYLLISACGPSRLRQNDRQCGAGEECDLIWLKLDRAWTISDIKSVLYESCWTTVTSTDGPEKKENLLNLVYDDFTKNLHFTLTYNADLPEQGIKIAESAIPNGTD